MSWQEYIPRDIAELYEIHDRKHAAAILANEFPQEFTEICEALREFRFTEEDVKQAGGNESRIPKKFSELLRDKGWKEKQLNAKLIVDDKEVSHDTHKVDYIKGRVAFDLEWNSKDQTFDRDLYAFRTFFDYDNISLGILVTRSEELNPWIISLGPCIDEDGNIERKKNGKPKRYIDKYGASTTHIGKLLHRLDAGRNGGCPVLVFGITTQLLTT